MYLAIVGCGPRGLSALENVYAQAALKNTTGLVLTTVFEETDQLGNGPIYDREQPDSNWLNVSERGLTIPHREAIRCENLSIPYFPSYQEWCGYNEEDLKADYFPLRSVLGKYLNERFYSIADVLIEKKLLTIVPQKVIGIMYKDDKFILNTQNNQTFRSDETVLTIGHQPTVIDDEIARWMNVAQNRKELTLLQNPYPIKNLIKAIENENCLGLRGFGLAMIDAVRAATQEKGGSFHIVDKDTRKMVYKPAKSNPITLLPFSLDGLPMTPKPLNKKLDTPFIPSKKELGTLSGQIRTAIENGTDLDKGRFVIISIAPIIAAKFFHLEQRDQTATLSQKKLKNIILAWLEDESFEHKLILSKTIGTHSTIKKYIGMATGQSLVSLDYCIGQVWRHCQPTMYEALSFADLNENVMAALIGRDERLKRYSYGPPVDSMQQLSALVDEGTMNLDFVDNPAISVSNLGWTLKKNDKTLTTKTMVDSVLDSPKLCRTRSPLITSLLKDALVKPVHDDLGITTHENGLVKLFHKTEQPNLAILGRLAKGTLVGVDAILECFGIRSKLWAKGVVARIKS